MAGVLAGLTIIEFAGIGPAPFCGMMLADHGAKVVRIDRTGASSRFPDGALSRGRRTIKVDLANPAARDLVKRLCAGADGIIEGFRPGVMERLGLGPDELLGLNDRLVYGRMTGLGQYGPLADRAGHDINYIAIAGALPGIGRKGERPVPPVNYVADFGGGGMLLSFGMVAALLAVARGGRGQVVDAAMVDGTALLLGMNWGLMAANMWRDERGSNLIDGGSHFYDTYETLDGKFVAVGPVEPQFYREMLEKLGLGDDPSMGDHINSATWAASRSRLAAVFGSNSRDYWAELFRESDACVTPVLSLSEAAAHPHNVARGTYGIVGTETQPMPAPRFSRTPAIPPALGAANDATCEEILSEIGVSTLEIAALRKVGAIACSATGINGQPDGKA